MSQVQNAPLSNVGNLEIGQFVKLFGKIDAPPHTVVVSGYNPGGKGGQWSYTFQNFLLVQGNSAIFVDMGGVGTNVLGHGPNGTENTVVFGTGDSIALAGTVERNSSGYFLKAVRAADNVGDLFDPSAEELVGLLAVAGGGSTAVFVFIVYRLRRRLKLHDLQLATHLPSFYGQGNEPTPPS